MGQERIPDEDYEAGFVAGWQAVKGVEAALPALPAEPAMWGNMTRFLMGVRTGLRLAGVSLD